MSKKNFKKANEGYLVERKVISFILYLFIGFSFCPVVGAAQGAQGPFGLDDSKVREILATEFADWEIDLALGSAGLERPLFQNTKARSRCSDYRLIRSPFFGDLHVHTSLSMDAFLGGNILNDPREAYRFARGDSLGIAPYDSAGNPVYEVQLRRPLDFAAVTDHAEFFGEVRICNTPGHPGYDSPECQSLRVLSPASPQIWFGALLPLQPSRFGFCGPDEQNCLDMAATVWEDVQAAAEEGYDRSPDCELTTFIGYEWSGTPGGANLHRNVLFRNEDVPELPTSYLDAPTPELLWSALEADCLEAGGSCDTLAIPHNSNLSLGRMFLPENSDGSPLSSTDAARRAALEPLVEIIQTKGSSECRTGVGTTDELCDFELMRQAGLAVFPGQAAPFSPSAFVRNSLQEGLRVQEEIGANPFKLGFVGGTDTHNSTAGLVDEEGFQGHTGALDSSLPGRLAVVDNNPGGLTVIWAEENSRDALFDALERREVYATSGTRPVVRFFGSFLYPESLCRLPIFNHLGYILGVPMGGDLETPGQIARYRAPRFAVSALKDPGTPERPGRQLQRIQIIKGWVEDGTVHEEVYEVAGDPIGNAEVGPAGEPIGLGFDSLCAVWEDPDFDPERPAFYYARVLENPSWRWSTRQCHAAGIDCSEPSEVPPELEACCAQDIPTTIQERAWTSPIWYSP